ncbi:hypothetical protein KUCAC02_004775 [Chaenocephalus aceratus]|uniref:Uncharacterized protein n=1 Tax=Chaenocephalus aceratus TaxID=36190 RepID=A0ACB9WZK3_CHAAC|nr:hypothetical protein KUCAC02_004775 [Chaenocephalus aceratus]
MGVALMALEIKWRWTTGMPVARMWAPGPSWDALPRPGFPDYRVLGNPPWLTYGIAAAKPPATAPLAAHLSSV